MEYQQNYIKYLLTTIKYLQDEHQIYPGHLSNIYWTSIKYL